MGKKEVEFQWIVQGSLVVFEGLELHQVLGASSFGLIVGSLGDRGGKEKRKARHWEGRLDSHRFRGQLQSYNIISSPQT